MKILFLLFLIFPILSKAERICEYMKFTNRANSYIMNQEFNNALKCYDSAFVVLNHPFPEDIANALKCTILIKNYKRANTYVNRLIRIGCPLDFFEKQHFYRGYLQSKWFNKIKKEYPKKRQSYLDKNDWDSRKIIDSIYLIDQMVRLNDRTQINTVDNKNKPTILNLLRSGKFNTYNIGVYIIDDSIIQSHSSIYILVLHNYIKMDTAQNKLANLVSYDYTKILDSNVIKGFIHPEEFACLNSRSVMYNVKGRYGEDDMIMNLNGEDYFLKYSDSALIQTNINRKNLCLLPLGEQRKKAIYQSNQNKYKFQLFHGGQPKITVYSKVSTKMINAAFECINK